MGLWRNSGVGGGELYPPGVRESIEREIFGVMAPPPPPPPSFLPPMPNYPTQQQVQIVLNTTLESKHRQAAANPQDRIAATHVGALIQIAELLNTKQVPPIELQQIMDQFKGMGPNLPPVPVMSPIPPPISRDHYRPTPPVITPAPLPIPVAPASNPALPDNFADMLRNLTSSGLISTPRTPEPAKIEPPKPKSSLDAYEEMILALDLTLRSLDLNQ